MRQAWRASRRRRAAALAAIVGALGGLGAARAADLPPYQGPLPPGPAVRVYPARPIDPGPASSSGYYGYYGVDIGGTPYDGLYSADAVCLRSIPTPRGYRTVDVCR